MTDAAFDGKEWRRERREAVTLPAPVVLSAPVFISDCATPLAGETVLSLLWKRLDRDG